jgi:CDP-diacylglycerol--glycerol-3-phosphate 3-phosphatidyltransferase
MSLGLFLLVLVAALASMAAYVLQGTRLDADSAAKEAQFLGGLGDFFIHWFMWAVIAPATRLSVRIGLTADHYNFAGLAFGLLSGTAIGLGRLELGGWALVLTGVCDILDGKVARATASTSVYGDFIDSTLDRFVEVCVFLGFALFLDGVGPLVATAALGGSLLVSYTRARGEALGVECKGGLLQRAERLVLLSLACLLDPALTARLGWRLGTFATALLAVIAVFSLATVIHRTVWISRRLLASQARGEPESPAYGEDGVSTS